MKREILFRGLSFSGEWVYGCLIQYENSSQIGVLKYADVMDFVKVRPETVGEFTGLTDKRGTKIFEGDILKSELNWIFAVKWDNENARFIGYSPTKQLIYVGREPKATVIGNILYNPELS